jgi:cyclomaltodextrin glucanotransferase
MQVPGYEPANIGYLGGDFQGVLDNADYIADMGFTAIWTTPIVNNPDEAFTGSTAPGRGPGGDLGKTGYHGYWGVNFFEVDEHLESPGLTFADFTRQLREQHGLKYVLDVVCNHGSPAYTMPIEQPMFGKLYDGDGVLVADHQNLPPAQLDPDNPLHAFFNRKTDLGELSDLNENNPDVLEYFVAAYSQWPPPIRSGWTRGRMPCASIPCLSCPAITGEPLAIACARSGPACSCLPRRSTTTPRKSQCTPIRKTEASVCSIFRASRP